MTKCPFCFEADDGRARIMIRNDQAMGLLSNPRLVEGHSLVVPERHVEDPQDLTKAELLAIFEIINHISAKLLEGGLANGIDTRQHFRPFLKESRTKVNHVHFHVLPRAPQDELHMKSLQYETMMFVDLPEDERTKMESIINT